LNATARVSTLYDRYCIPGKQRAELAKQLVASSVRSAVVQIGPMTSTSTSASPSMDAVAPPIPAKPVKPKRYTVKRGDTLTDITRTLGCEPRDLARTNKLKAPKYAIHPGQTLSLAGCND
jgi:membrane-bound lytic murein transglycosylase D